MIYNIIIFGDSITQGAFDEECGGWVSRLTAYTHKKTVLSDFADQSCIYNRGISGDTVLDLRKRFENELPQCTADNEKTAVLFAIGKNDSAISTDSGQTATPIETYRDVLGSLIRDAQLRDAFVGCVGLGMVDETKTNPIVWNPALALRNEILLQFDAAMQDAAGNAVLYIPIVDMFKGRPDLVPDGLHPDAKGHQLIFERVKEYLEKAGVI